MSTVDVQAIKARTDLREFCADFGLKKKTAKEDSGPCPVCKAGDDRFSVQSDKWLCRVCTGGKWRDAPALVAALYGLDLNLRGDFMRMVEILDGKQSPAYSPSELQAMKQKREVERAAEAETAKARIADFTSRHVYTECYERCTMSGKAWWERQGLPSDAQAYWQLGEAQTAAWGRCYTIPFPDETGAIVNMQFRLSAPPEPNNKYRWVGLGKSSYFVARPELGKTDVSVILEGAKKGAVFAYHIASGGQQTYAVPSRSDFAGIATAVSHCGLVYVVLDPDAPEDAMRLTALIGKTARVVSCPDKPDDMITQSGADDAVFAALFRQAYRAGSGQKAKFRG